MSSNLTNISPAPIAPLCTLVPQAPLIPGITDNVLAVILPTIIYAVVGGFFHVFDTFELFSQYRIHPSEDELKRNHITKWQCLQSVVRYHVMQISIGLLLSYGDGPTMVGDDACQIHRAAGMISRTRNLIPLILSLIGIDARRLGHVMESMSPQLAYVIGGSFTSGENSMQMPRYAALEISLAKLVIFFVVPAVQYLVALAVVDTWIYFTHRLCHINKTLYRKFCPVFRHP